MTAEEEQNPAEEVEAEVRTTNPKEAAQSGNMFEQASGLQNFLALLGIDIVVIVLRGGVSGVSVRKPGGECEAKDDGIDVCDVIEEIDNDCGLKMPISIHTMLAKRGISFRSPRRVPTHMVVYMGTGYDMPTTRQAYGR